MGTIVRTLYAHDLVEHNAQHEGYAPDWDAYKALLARAESLAPPQLSDGCRSPLVLLDEQVVALVNSAWLAGAEYGERLMNGELAPSAGD